VTFHFFCDGIGISCPQVAKQPPPGADDHAIRSQPGGPDKITHAPGADAERPGHHRIIR
jgi:hypothetical protein